MKTEIPIDKCEINRGTEEIDCPIGEDRICEEKWPPAELSDKKRPSLGLISGFVEALGRNRLLNENFHATIDADDPQNTLKKLGQKNVDWFGVKTSNMDGACALKSHENFCNQDLFAGFDFESDQPGSVGSYVGPGPELEQAPEQAPEPEVEFEGQEDFHLRQGLECGYHDLAKRQYQEFQSTNCAEESIQFESLWKSLYTKCKPNHPDPRSNPNTKLQYIHIQCCYLANLYNPCNGATRTPANINFDYRNFTFIGRTPFFTNLNKNTCKECKKICNTKCSFCKNENFHYKCLSPKNCYLSKDLLCLQCGKFRSVYGRKRGGHS